MRSCQGIVRTYGLALNTRRKTRKETIYKPCEGFYGFLAKLSPNGTSAILAIPGLCGSEPSQVSSLRKANEALNKRRRAQKTWIRQGGSLSFQDAQGPIDQKDAVQQIEKVTRENGGRQRRVETRERRCGRCGNPGHNTRTCLEDIATSFEEESD